MILENYGSGILMTAANHECTRVEIIITPKKPLTYKMKTYIHASVTAIVTPCFFVHFLCSRTQVNRR